jgi:hypothetical protein
LIHVAAGFGHSEVVALIVSECAKNNVWFDVTVKDSHGRTALALAETMGHGRVVRVLTGVLQVHSDKGTVKGTTGGGTTTEGIAEVSETTPNNRTAPRDVLQTLPTFMQQQIFAFFGYKDYTLAGQTCPYLKRLWQEAIQNHRIPGTLFVPGHCHTLNEAVGKVHGDDRLTTIVVGKGHHQTVGQYLEIDSAMNIVGDPEVVKSNLVVVGGILFKKGIRGNCHLQHLTLRQAKYSGVHGETSFTMEDVLVEHGNSYGVVAVGRRVVGRCTNVEVRQCRYSGVVAFDGASVTLIGAKTTVHHTCTGGRSDTYGLQVYGSSSSTIQLVSPLTKEHVAIDNGGGGNWGKHGRGALSQIKTIAAAPAV